VSDGGANNKRAIEAAKTQTKMSMYIQVKARLSIQIGDPSHSRRTGKTGKWLLLGYIILAFIVGPFSCCYSGLLLLLC
jgi:hypothetical protein